MSIVPVDSTELRIAAVVPCRNEEATVAEVVADLQAAVPGIVVYVYDNLSTDQTMDRARAAGGIVRREQAKGKGNVVRRAFADIEADVYVMIDGDGTYEAAATPLMIKTLLDGPYDQVLGVRKPDVDCAAYRPGHHTGNKVLNGVVGKVFGENVEDMLSGFRVFSRRFVKSFPAVSREFEIETELTVHALHLRVPRTAVPVGFRSRLAGSESKLRTYHDGWKILALIIGLARHERPVAFYGLFGTLSWVVSVLITLPIIIEFYHVHEVPRFPTLLLGFTLVLLGSLAWTAGLVLDGIRRYRHEAVRLVYLGYPAVGTVDSYLNDRDSDDGAWH
ncbi:glycosyltransferase [Nocardia sp. 004]|uniref:glycosyltransferase n=1 Tax=Nocardia sp. 004 TaxID=3385978 RepID=UPI0039A1EF81